MTETMLFDTRKLEFPLSENDMHNINEIRSIMESMNGNKNKLSDLVELTNQIINIKNKIGTVVTISIPFKISRYKMKQGDQLIINNIKEDSKGNVLVEFHNLRVGNKVTFFENKNKFIDCVDFYINTPLTDDNMLYVFNSEKREFSEVNGFQFNIGNIQSFIYENEYGEYALVEMQTGLNLAVSKDINKLIEIAENRIEENKDKIEEVINKAIERNGMSPNKLTEPKQNTKVEVSAPVTNNKNKLQIKEIYCLYKNTFSTYSEAYNYALKYKIPVTMIISSNHPSMTNERLRQLEHEYVFSKGNMAISDIQEYFTYISSLDTTLDQQKRYYKLKSYIDKHSYSQQQKQTQKECQQNLMKEAATILYFMKKKGLSIIENGDCGIVSTKYIYNNETIYHDVRGSGGVTIEKYHQMITDIFNKHFSQYRDEYNELTLYWHTLPSKEYNHLMNIEGFMFTDMTKGEYGILCFDRLLTSNENKLYNLNLYN